MNMRAFSCLMAVLCLLVVTTHIHIVSSTCQCYGQPACLLQDICDPFSEICKRKGLVQDTIGLDCCPNCALPCVCDTNCMPEYLIPLFFITYLSLAVASFGKTMIYTVSFSVLHVAMLQSVLARGKAPLMSAPETKIATVIRVM